MPTVQWQLGSRAGLVGEGVLELDGTAQRLARRVEDREGLVAAELDELAAPGLDRLRWATSAKVAARRDAASSPCWAVKRV